TPEPEIVEVGGSKRAERNAIGAGPADWAVFDLAVPAVNLHRPAAERHRVCPQQALGQHSFAQRLARRRMPRFANADIGSGGGDIRAFETGNVAAQRRNPTPDERASVLLGP